ncbi:MAG: DUF1501 domain-containing protein [Myxococcales bacterium]|nr:DUF1501 domain-containing protein [Myxococcales bacterium]
MGSHSYSRRGLLGAGAALLAASQLRNARASNAPRNLVVVFAEGGWDTTYSLDPKLDVTEIVGPMVDANRNNPADVDELQRFGELPVVVNEVRRPAVGSFFAEYGARSCLVNGVFCGAVGHPLARTRVLTGTDLEHRPDLAVIYGAEAGGDLPVASFAFSRWQHLGALESGTARTGGTLQFEALVRPRDPRWLPSEVQEREVLDHLKHRNERMAKHWSDRGGHNDARLADHWIAEERAKTMRDTALQAELDLTNVPSFLQRSRNAAAVLAAGLTRSVFLSLDGFDTHGATAKQNTLQEELFGGVHALVRELDDLGLLDDTLVVVTSEMTRTPVRNSMGGKDHWPYVSYLFLGASTPRNRLLGGTDERMEGVAVDLATGQADRAGQVPRHDNVVAGILSAMDVDPEPWLPGVTPWGGLQA